jgi:APA family basic amino acid/polyamine antiporter
MQKRALLRVLGVSFGVAVTLGSTIGLGILRTPGTVAAHLGSARLVIAVWTIGGLYALLGTLAVTELTTMLPQAGGWYVYARRALGDYAGFTVGWINWASFCTSAASIAIAIGDYGASLAPVLSGKTRVMAVAVLLLFTLLHGFGVRLGSRTQEWTSFTTALGFVALVVACAVHGGSPASTAMTGTGASVPSTTGAFLIAAAVSFQSVIFTYDGWYSAIYFSEEDTDPARNLPRSMIGSVSIVIALYLLVNSALLRVLPFSQLAASRLPAADAAQVMFGARGSDVITALSFLSLVTITNATFMQTPRILYGMSRDGLFARAAGVVNRRGTPIVALAIGSVVEILLVLSGTFDTLLATTAALFVVMYGSGFVSLLVLRKREPELPRPFTAWGYPWTVAIVLVLSLVFLAGVVIGDPVDGGYALIALTTSYPLYRLVKSTGRRSCPTHCPGERRPKATD